MVIDNCMVHKWVALMQMTFPLLIQTIRLDIRQPEIPTSYLDSKLSDVPNRTNENRPNLVIHDDYDLIILLSYES